MKELWVVYRMASYLDGDYPVFIGIYEEKPDLADNEYAELVEMKDE